MFGIAAVIAFAIALIMHLAGWGSAHLDVETFTLIGLVCLSVHLCFGWGHRNWNRTGA